MQILSEKLDPKKVIFYLIILVNIPYASLL